MFYYLSIPPEVPTVCRLELNTYPCDKRHLQYFFNLNTMTCEPLSFHLCSKSLNIFPDEDTCKKRCEPSKSEYFNCGFLFKIFYQDFKGKSIIWPKINLVCMPGIAQSCDIGHVCMCACMYISGIKPRLCRYSQLPPWRKQDGLPFPWVGTSWRLMMCAVLETGWPVTKTLTNGATFSLVSGTLPLNTSN